MQTNSFYHMASTVIGGRQKPLREYTEKEVSAEASLGKALEAVE